MSEIVEVQIDRIDANPHRLLKTYPYSEDKLATLRSSIASTGFWEGVIARKAGSRYQIAFGHHRVEAARLEGLKRVPLVVRNLTDEQMLQLMGRENMEDYSASFLVLLETWEAAAGFLRDTSRSQVQPLDIARLLGWTRLDERRGEDRVNDTALATSGAHQLIEAGYNTHADFEGLTVRSAREIVQRAQSLLSMADRTVKTQPWSAAKVEQGKKQVAKAVKKTAEQVRKGEVAQRDIRSTIDVNTFQATREAKRRTPLFDVFGKVVAETIRKMLAEDRVAKKLDEIVKALPQIEMDEDKAILKRIDFELAELGERTDSRRKQLAPNGKVIPLNRLKGA